MATMPNIKQIKNGSGGYTTIEEVTAINPNSIQDGQIFSISTGAGEGSWYATTSDISTEVTNDPQGGIYRPWDGEDGSTGGVILFDGVVSFPLKVTVGSGGTFSTVNEALGFLINLQPALNVRVDIEQLAGFTYTEQLFVDGDNLSWISLTSVDPEVTITRASLTETYPGLDNSSTPAFAAVNNGSLPVIETLYNMDTSGVAGTQDGIIVAWGSSVVVESGGGVKNAARRGLYGVNANMYARGADFSGAGTIGCRPGNNSQCVIRECTITGCGEYGIFASGASICIAQDSDIYSNGLDNIRIENGATVMADNSIMNLAGRDNISVRDGGRFIARTCDISQATNNNISGEDAYIFVPNSDVSFAGDREVTARGGSIVSVESCDLQTDNDGQYNIAATAGAKVIAIGATINSGFATYLVQNGGEIILTGLGTGLGTNVTPNTITTDGIIFTDDVTKENGDTFISIGNTSVVVTHGVTVNIAIRDITISPKEQFNGASQIWVSSVDNVNGQFTITADAAVAGSALDIAYQISKV